MSHIYRQTKQNLVYLGDEAILEQGTKSVLSILQEVREQTDGLRNLRSILVTDNNALRVAQTPISASFDLESLAALLSNAWFSRLWVLQEVTLAPLSICHCGNVQIPLLDILTTTLWLRYKHRFLPPSLVNLEGLNHATMLWDFVDPVHGNYQEVRRRPSINMLPMLKMARSLDTLDSRDRVFACLGMLKCTSSLRGVPIALKPDYETPPRTNFSSATRIAIYESGFDETLNLISHRAEYHSLHDPDWPSWIPRWSIRRNLMHDAWTFDTEIFAAGAIHLSQHNALDTSHGEPSELKLRGFVQVCPNRRIFATKSGYLGLGPSVAVEDAIIVIFHQCKLPYMLRYSRHGRQGTYRMMGPCYIHGIMNGEFAEKCRMAGIADKEFVIA